MSERSGLPSPLGLWPKPRGETTSAFLHFSVCGQSRGVKGAWAFLHLSKCGQNRGVKGAAFLELSVCGQNSGVKGPRPSLTGWFVAKAEGPHLSICGQNNGVKGARPPGLWAKQRGVYAHFSVFSLSCFLILFLLFSDSCFPILLCFLILSVLFSDPGCVVLSGCFRTSPSLVSELVFLMSPVAFGYPLHSDVNECFFARHNSNKPLEERQTHRVLLS